VENRRAPLALGQDRSVTGTVRYSTTMAALGRNTGVPVPPEVLEQLGGGGRPAVLVTVNGYRYSSTVGSMGGQTLISFSSERRAESGIGGGDALEVELELDTSPRDTAVPDDLAASLAAAGVTEAFAALAPSRRKAHVVSVEGAKAPETRTRRIEAVVAQLTA
jgi:hypothetical protein